MNDDDKLTEYNILKTLNFHSTEPRKGEYKSARRKDCTKYLPNNIEKKLNPRISLTAGESEDGPNSLQGEGMNINISSNNIDNWTRLEVLVR